MSLLIWWTRSEPPRSDLEVKVDIGSISFVLHANAMPWGKGTSTPTRFGLAGLEWFFFSGCLMIVLPHPLTNLRVEGSHIKKTHRLAFLRYVALYAYTISVSSSCRQKIVGYKKLTLPVFPQKLFVRRKTAKSNTAKEEDPKQKKKLTVKIWISYGKYASIGFGGTTSDWVFCGFNFFWIMCHLFPSWYWTRNSNEWQSAEWDKAGARAVREREMAVEETLNRSQMETLFLERGMLITPSTG